MKNLSLYYPVKPYYVTQKFGETEFLDYYKKNGINFIGHNGIDIIAKHGQPVYASHAGTAYSQIDDKSGHGVIIITDEMFLYKEIPVFFKSIYWHLTTEVLISNEGQKVKAGDLIGYADSTGLSSGDHLHFGLKPMLLSHPGDYTNFEQTNGYMGAIDPEAYFNGQYANNLNLPPHIFNKDLSMFDSGEEVRLLQIRLKEIGCFPTWQECTGYYGGITREAVFNFQLNYVNLTLWETMFLKGRKFGIKTRNALNSIK